MMRLFHRSTFIRPASNIKEAAVVFLVKISSLTLCFLQFTSLLSSSLNPLSEHVDLILSRQSREALTTSLQNFVPSAASADKVTTHLARVKRSMNGSKCDELHVTKKYSHLSLLLDAGDASRDVLAVASSWRLEAAVIIGY